MRTERRMLQKLCAAGIAAMFVVSSGSRGTDTLPAQIPDDTYWKWIDSSSEPAGAFPSENFTSNENGFQKILPELLQASKPGGVYMGVGPEQNFTYIVALKPKIAIIIDIRRQNLLEHLLYKALFEMSDNRADFLSQLFGRKRPAGVSDQTPIGEMLAAYDAEPTDEVLYARTLQEIEDLLVKKHKFGLDKDDREGIEHVYTVFSQYGPKINYDSAYPIANNGLGSGNRGANFTTVMTATDSFGQQRGFLATEDNFHFIKNFEANNLLIPLVGDFGGPKALRAAGLYLKDHGATVTAFYTSNVEQYLFSPGQGPRGRGVANGGAVNFYNNVATLPLDANSIFIRSNVPGNNGGRGNIGTNSTMLASIQATVAAVKSGRIRSYTNLLTIQR